MQTKQVKEAIKIIIDEIITFSKEIIQNKNYSSIYYIFFFNRISHSYRKNYRSLISRMNCSRFYYYNYICNFRKNFNRQSWIIKRSINWWNIQAIWLFYNRSKISSQYNEALEKNRKDSNDKHEDILNSFLIRF